MYVIEFSSLKAVEYTDLQRFDQRIRKWLLLRQGENTYILEHLYRLRHRDHTATPLADRLFTVEDGDHVMAAGILMSGGCLCLTWATEEISEVLIRGMLQRNGRITSVYGPGCVSNRFAELWARQSGQVVDYGRSERVYQINRVAIEPPPTGRLEPACADDRSFLSRWMANFMGEAHMEPGPQDAPRVLEELLAHQALFLWKDPEPRAMAAWVCSAEAHHSINIVYVPPIHRGKGAAKAVTAALASRILASNNSGCFILTDTQDELTNHVYRSIGGMGVAELLRCTLHDKTVDPPAELAAPARSRLNIVPSSRSYTL